MTESQSKLTWLAPNLGILYCLVCTLWLCGSIVVNPITNRLILVLHGLKSGNGANSRQDTAWDSDWPARICVIFLVGVSEKPCVYSKTFIFTDVEHFSWIRVLWAQTLFRARLQYRQLRRLENKPERQFSTWQIPRAHPLFLCGILPRAQNIWKKNY